MKGWHRWAMIHDLRNLIGDDERAIRQAVRGTAEIQRRLAPPEYRNQYGLPDFDPPRARLSALETACWLVIAAGFALFAGALLHACLAGKLVAR